MSSKDLKIFKKSSTENPLSGTENIHINNLNDDCLLEIFQYLNAAEKLNNSLVCKKWANFLAHTLIINDKLINEDFRKIRHEDRITPFIVKFIEKCSFYLHSFRLENLTYHFNFDLNISLVLQTIANNCKNLMDFKFCVFQQEFNVNDLELVFANNVNLSSIYLAFYVKFNGKFFLKLQPLNLEEFSIHNLELESENDFFYFLSQLKNIKKIHLSFRHEYSIKSIRALNESNCDKITDLSLKLSDGFDEMSDLIRRQKRIQKFSFSTEIIVKKLDTLFLDALSEESLEELQVIVENNPINHYPFQRFKKLEVLEWWCMQLTDESAKALSECKKLKKLILHRIENYSLTKTGANHLSQIQSLESFEIYMTRWSLDDVLIGLSKCENLKTVDISHCNFSAAGIDSLCQLPNLTYLKAAGTSISTKDLRKLAKKSLKLKKVDIKSCTHYDFEIITKVYEISDIKLLYDWPDDNY